MSMDARKIVVVGSSNTDMVVQSSHLPAPGETVLGGEFTMNPGGKGANQAVAAVKMGGEVAFIARVGNDLFGKEAIKGFDQLGIDTQFIAADEQAPSGIALINVNEEGENCISVALGANAKMSIEDLDSARDMIGQAAYILVQLEIPMVVVEHLGELAHELEVPLVLNPAPAQPLSSDLLERLYMITPNQSEAELLTGVKVVNQDTAHEAAVILQDKGVKNVIITMGSQGVYVLAEGLAQMVESPAVEVVDTTAAGDTFNGALVTGLAEGIPLLEAIEMANQAAALSVTKVGAQSAIPFRKELINLNK